MDSYCIIFLLYLKFLSANLGKQNRQHKVQIYIFLQTINLFLHNYKRKFIQEFNEIPSQKKTN